MHEALFEYFKKFNSEPLREEEEALIRQAFIPFKLRKKQYLLQAGDHCRHFAFVVKGAMRQYSVDEKGVEHIIRLGIEGWWMGDRESWVTGRSSAYHIDAWEHTEMLLVTKTSIDLLLDKTTIIAKMMLQLDERNNIANQRRVTSTISATAEKKYADFAACYPHLIERFPQHIIASYLGITKDTLSRVKRRHLQR